VSPGFTETDITISLTDDAAAAAEAAKTSRSV